MNERIRELAEQAKFAMNVSNDPNSPPSWWAAGHNDTFEKFAKLVITETTNWINENVGYVDASARVDLMKHFGVEE
jgi:hypothetical protein